MITETGAEVVSEWLPMDMDGIERVMKEEGMLQRYPRDGGGNDGTPAMSPDAVAASRARGSALRAVLVWVAFLLLVAAGVWWMTAMPGRSHSGPRPPLSAEEADLRGRLEGHVRALAGRIGERNVFQPAHLAAAARFLEDQLAGYGHAVTREDFRTGELVVRNLVVERRGSTKPDEIVVVGAHYDSVMGSPGANDNATGVAALLEIARALDPRSSRRGPCVAPSS